MASLITEKEEKRKSGEQMAKKSLRERLAETSERTDAQESAKRLAKFVTYWEEVENAFRDGWSYKDIWRVLSRDGDIDFSYSSFLNFVRKVKRRQLDSEMEKMRGAGDGKSSATKKPVNPAKPGTTKLDLPLFGQDVKPRDPKRF